MSQISDTRPLKFDDPNDFDRLRDVLARADYTDRGVTELLDVKDARAISGCDVDILRRRTAGGTPLETLVRLFLVGVSVDVAAARRAVEPMTLEEWTAAGLLQVQDDAVRAAVQLLPFQGLLIAFDRPQHLQSQRKEDYVMGIGSSTLTLANLTVRRPAQAALDLGTGCGLLAFLAARHSAQVVAVDCNARAVEMAAFNVRLNNLPNVDCLAGDLFAPVAGRLFDLIVSNPPFVISPERRYIYRDGGMHGDGITRRIVSEAPQLLRDDEAGKGGYCQILCNWAHIEGEDWQQRLAGWFERTGCDAWVMRTDTLDAPDYALKWIRHTERDDTEGFAERLDEWTAYYRRERIEAVSGGLITMRRRSGAANWFRADDGPEKMLGPAGEGIAEGFELRDFLEDNHDDNVLLGRRLRISPDARLRQAFEPSPEGWLPIESQLELSRGLAYSGAVDPYMAQLIARCDGQHRLGELLVELARSAGKEPSELAPTLLDVVRRLIERGFLLPSS